MLRYYLTDGSRITGPYTRDELQGRALDPSIRVCREGSDRWALPADMPELSYSVQHEPPVPIHGSTDAEPPATVAAGESLNERLDGVAQWVFSVISRVICLALMVYMLYRAWVWLMR